MSKVTDPALLAELNGESKPTKVVDPKILAELREMSAKDAKREVGPTETEPSVPEGSVIGDFARVAGSIGSSILAEPASGLYGLMTAAGTGGDSERAAEAVGAARDALTFSPQTQGSRDMMASVGDFLAPVGEAFETVSSFLGDEVLEWTGSPELATVAYSLPTAALELVGVKGLRGIKRMSEADVINAQKAALRDPELRYSGSVAEVKLNSKGQLVKDKAGISLVENGIRPNDAAVITNSSKATKARMARMADVFEQGKGNDVFSMSNKTTSVIGESVTQRLSAAKLKREALGKRLNAIVEGEAGKASVDISDSLSGLNSALTSEGVVPAISRTGKVTLPEDWHKGSVFELSKMAPARKAIEDAYRLFEMNTANGQTTLRQAHKLKKNLDELIDASKLSQSGVSNNTIRTLAGVRRSVNESLSGISGYGAVNRELRSIIEAMEPFSRYMKPGEDWVDARVSGVVGQAMKDLAADSARASDLAEGLTSLDTALRASGISFKDDPRALMRFRQTLLENFNIDPKVPEGGVRGALTGAAMSASVQNTFGVAHDVKRLIEAGMAKGDAKDLAKRNKKAFNAIKMAVRN